MSEGLVQTPASVEACILHCESLNFKKSLITGHSLSIDKCLVHMYRLVRLAPKSRSRHTRRNLTILILSAHIELEIRDSEIVSARNAPTPLALRVGTR